MLVVDRYEIGERQTSACAAPTEWLEALGLEDSIRQTFGDLVIHRPGSGDRRRKTYRWHLPWSFSTFDYPQLCALLAEQGDFAFETAKVDGRTRDGNTHVVHTDRGDLRAPLVVDALGWRRVLSDGPAIQPPDARLSRGLEVHPGGTSEDLELWLDAGYVRAGLLVVVPGRRRGARRRRLVRPARSTSRSRPSGWPSDLGRPPEGYQGNWIPHQLRPATERRRVLRRRQRRPLPAHDRRGHPPRALLRPRLRARAARGRRGPPDPRAGAGALRVVQRRAQVGVRLAVARADDLQRPQQAAR